MKSYSWHKQAERNDNHRERERERERPLKRKHGCSPQWAPPPPSSTTDNVSPSLSLFFSLSLPPSPFFSPSLSLPLPLSPLRAPQLYRKSVIHHPLLSPWQHRGGNPFSVSLSPTTPSPPHLHLHPFSLSLFFFCLADLGVAPFRPC